MCGMFETNQELDNKPKTPKEKIVGRALSTMVCVCVRNKSKTWKQKIERDKIHLLQKVGNKLYTGDKINLLQKVEKSKIKKFRVKLYTKIILSIRLITGVKRNTFNKRSF